MYNYSTVTKEIQQLDSIACEIDPFPQTVRRLITLLTRHLPSAKLLYMFMCISFTCCLVKTITVTPVRLALSP